MIAFREILQDGHWRYGIVVDLDTDGSWDWRAMRIPLDGRDDQIIDCGKADSSEEAARCAEVSLQADQERKRRCPIVDTVTVTPKEQNRRTVADARRAATS